MTVDRIPLAGVIGSPVAHSRSPRLFSHWLRKMGLQGHYIPMDIAADKLESVLRTLPDLGFVGCNVTIPYKERVMEIADHVSDRAVQIGAANTLVFREDGTIHADNTDGYGFVENLRQNAPDWDPTGGPATVFGAGGAARAILASLLDVGVPEIRLTNRSRDRAEQLREDFGDRITVHDWVQAGNIVEGCTTVVNTTSLGMTGKPELRVPLDALEPGMLVTDIVYTPLQTRLLRVAQDQGCATVDGLGMLLHQAVPGFERWFGERPEVDDATRAAVLR
ncbi:shikimate dehydrogenase [Tropicibacter naphthalenivorans]|uniref:Shikimate dehydrogenase (NADP(+)) n=1 Tax=Tropicibacter naphthalenivorans TaxID=441103 RepID=A0A0N7M072_9RHOB|nr:shikimate dehydrogenase [Tropicibacter naphthalenivorans]CUH79657.1 Shikimate dehydrogenase [Tropicibacter naphthalenivorans]SMC74150.1 shikimate dehydrogenase [Tropicibacter naphthalenivorans]